MTIFEERCTKEEQKEGKLVTRKSHFNNPSTYLESFNLITLAVS